MNIRDTLTYATIIPMVFGIVGILIFTAVVGATGVAGIVIGIAELLHG